MDGFNPLKVFKNFMENHDPDLTAQEVALWIALFELNMVSAGYNGSDWVEWFNASQSQIMERSGIKKPHSVIRARNKLIEHGYITIQTSKGGKYSATKYKLNYAEMDIVKNESENSNHAKKDIVKPVLTMPKVALSINNKKQYNAHAHRAQRAAQFSFDTFYEQYPKKRERKRAENAWNRLTTQEQKAACEDLERRIAGEWKEWKTWKDNRDSNGIWHPAIPYPSSYLNGRRWEDEPDAQNQNSAPAELVKEEISPERQAEIDKQNQIQEELKKLYEEGW